MNFQRSAILKYFKIKSKEINCHIRHISIEGAVQIVTNLKKKKHLKPF